MRSLVLLMAVCAACQQRTEIIVGVATDLRAMGQIDSVALVAERSGVVVVMPAEWMLSDAAGQPYEIPGSFGLYSGDGSETAFDVSVKGFLKNNLVADREATLSLVGGQTLFLRLSLTAACAPGVRPACQADESCVEGTCQKKALDAHRLPAFRGELVTSTECNSGTSYVVSSTGMPMASLGDTCPNSGECHEGTCWKP
jgi:hypothetical protein